MDYWHKQTLDKPLYPDILWARPENRMGAGKLLIIGGNAMGFAAAGDAYQAAQQTGAGSVRILLPDSLRKTVGAILDNTEFAPSTPSGSFAKAALDDALSLAGWADMVLLAGDVGRNSETAVFLESFITKYQGPLVITKDIIEYFYALPETIMKRENTAVVLSLAQLQKLGIALRHDTPFLLSMGLMLLAQALHDFSARYPATIVTKELDSIVVAHSGQVASTKLKQDREIWRVHSAAAAATFWMHNPGKPLEAITSSLVV